MDFDHVGTHCTVKDCRLHDFLPVRCDACGKSFCGEHFGYEAHSCAAGATKRKNLSNQTLDCPECRRPVVVRKGEEEDAELARHLAFECGTTRRNRPCSAPQCKVREVIPIECKSCQKMFCFAHRNELDHACTKFTVPTATKKPTSSSSSSSSTRPAGSPALDYLRKQLAGAAASRMQRKKDAGPKTDPTKAPKTAAASTSVRVRPLGDAKLDPDVRILLQVASPLFKSMLPVDMIFNKRFTVGRMMDEAASLVRLTNLRDVRLHASQLNLRSGATRSLKRMDRLVDCVKPHECVVLDVAESLEPEYVTSLLALVDNYTRGSSHKAVIRVQS